MGPPRTRTHELVGQRGRFQEGSMRDRASAAPPVHFLGPQEREALGRPVWEGVRGRLRLRGGRDADDGERERERERERQRARRHAGGDERPPRDQVLASYQQLVASGFFSSHAVQSARHGAPPPPGCRPSTSHGAPGASVASSRGTKRAAESPVPSVCGDGEHERDERDERDDEHDDGEDESTLAHRFLPKRLRVAAARDISLPKLRSVASRKHLRAAVASARGNVSGDAHEGGGKDREPNKLTKRVLWAHHHHHHRQQQQQQQQQQHHEGVPLARASLDALPRGRGSGDVQGSTARKIRRPTSARNLRSAGTRERDGDGGLRVVVPDVNRGIPIVPDIPVKFTYGEDRENGVPWRGLRR
ncbi:uncharacterized protein MAM_04012 [Metarhizium album ARSEF 1941]|uniref:Uncharacterized protein n=1 Tax=Metarhizium album (strain ARSEF 1941) TaxID=1081103 RepID=A0A0B2WQE7_METAS|nr:uncharacterized protein MAM_04012 [Metarhizium album ARSEF 1941]KHN98251.1 hypothetical protein MAM_04012 [Metarhizium album ARSEF 1941]